MPSAEAFFENFSENVRLEWNWSFWYWLKGAARAVQYLGGGFSLVSSPRTEASPLQQRHIAFSQVRPSSQADISGFFALPVWSSKTKTHILSSKTAYCHPSAHQSIQYNITNVLQHRTSALLFESFVNSFEFGQAYHFEHCFPQHSLEWIPFLQ